MCCMRSKLTSYNETQINLYFIKLNKRKDGCGFFFGFFETTTKPCCIEVKKGRSK